MPGTQRRFCCDNGNVRGKLLGQITLDRTSIGQPFGDSWKKKREISGVVAKIRLGIAIILVV